MTSIYQSNILLTMNNQTLLILIESLLYIDDSEQKWKVFREIEKQLNDRSK